MPPPESAAVLFETCEALRVSVPSLRMPPPTPAEGSPSSMVTSEMTALVPFNLEDPIGHRTAARARALRLQDGRGVPGTVNGDRMAAVADVELVGGEHLVDVARARVELHAGSVGHRDRHVCGRTLWWPLRERAGACEPGLVSSVEVVQLGSVAVRTRRRRRRRGGRRLRRRLEQKARRRASSRRRQLPSLSIRPTMNRPMDCPRMPDLLNSAGRGRTPVREQIWIETGSWK